MNAKEDATSDASESDEFESGHAPPEPAPDVQRGASILPRHLSSLTPSDAGNQKDRKECGLCCLFGVLFYGIGVALVSGLGGWVIVDDGRASNAMASLSLVWYAFFFIGFFSSLDEETFDCPKKLTLVKQLFGIDFQERQRRIAKFLECVIMVVVCVMLNEATLAALGSDWHPFVVLVGCCGVVSAFVGVLMCFGRSHKRGWLYVVALVLFLAFLLPYSFLALQPTEVKRAMEYQIDPFDDRVADLLAHTEPHRILRDFLGMSPTRNGSDPPMTCRPHDPETVALVYGPHHAGKTTLISQVMKEAKEAGALTAQFTARGGVTDDLKRTMVLSINRMLDRAGAGRKNPIGSQISSLLVTNLADIEERLDSAQKPMVLHINEYDKLQKLGDLESVVDWLNNRKTGTKTPVPFADLRELFRVSKTDHS